ncbi:MAG: hypothetical protein ACPG31_02965 [Planctomycetota bacterium]
MRLRHLLVFLLSLASCSVATETHLVDPVIREPGVALGEIQDLVSSGHADQALSILQQQSWNLSRQVPMERLRQDLRVARGQRVAVLEELDSWKQQWPDHPDLAYLRTRLMEDPMGRYQAFAELLRLYPQHPWIRHGAIVSAQNVGAWNRSATWLETQARSLSLDAPGEASEQAQRLRLLQARQLRHAKDYRGGMVLLQKDAFQRRNVRALQEFLNLASLADDKKNQRRAEQEFLLLAAAAQDLPAAAAIDLAFERLLAEWPWCGEEDLPEVLQRFDHYLERAGAPSGWAAQPVYNLLGVAKLVQPESSSGSISRAFADAGRAVLVGSAWGRGNEIHLLRGTNHIRFLWPGHSKAVEVMVVESVVSSAGRTAQGGSVFRGFYMLKDSVARSAKRLQARLDSYLQEGKICVSPHKRDWEENRTLESLDLGLRLRVRTLGQSHWDTEQLELAHLALHESGHFGEVLHWIDYGLPVAGLVPRMLASNQAFGDPLMWLEYRAQLRAMTAEVCADWAFAEILERGQDPGDPYHAPYRRIFLDLVHLAEAEGWPTLAMWHEKDAADLAQLARTLCAKKGIQPLPQEGIQTLLQALIDADVLDAPPADGETPDQIHQR